MQITDETKHPIRVLLDDVTLARLLEVADGCQCDPSLVASAMLRDILEDDARAHDGDLATIPLQ